MKKLIATILMFSMILTVSTPSYAGQWNYDSNGWWYLNDDNSYPAKGWLQLDGSWYCFDSTGYMRTGWIQSENGNWYYTDPSTGAMLTNTWTPDGYYVDANGISAQYAEANPQSNQQVTTQSNVITADLMTQMNRLIGPLTSTVSSINRQINNSSSQRQLYSVARSANLKIQDALPYIDELITLIQPYSQLSGAYTSLSKFKSLLPKTLTGSSTSDIVKWESAYVDAVKYYEDFLSQTETAFSAVNAVASMILDAIGD